MTSPKWSKHLPAYGLTVSISRKLRGKDLHVLRVEGDTYAEFLVPCEWLRLQVNPFLWDLLRGTLGVMRPLMALPAIQEVYDEIIAADVAKPRGKR